MPTAESTELARRLQLVLTIDGKRPVDDPLKLYSALLADVTDDLANLADADAETGAEEGDRTNASGKKRKGYIELERQLRGAHRFIGAIDEEAIADEERAGVYESYLWRKGEIGRFDDERCVQLAKQAIQVAEKNLVKPEWRYPEVRLTRIKAQLAIIEGKTDEASTGDRQLANQARDAAFDLAETTLLRVRFWYCSATRDADKTPELAKIEYQPRREHGSQVEAETPTATTPVAVPPVGL